MHLKGVRRRPGVRSPAPGRLATHVVEMGAHLGTSSLGAGDQSPQGVRPQWWQSGDWVADPELRPVRDISSILSVRKCQPTDDACAGGNAVVARLPLAAAPPPREPRLPGSAVNLQQVQDHPKPGVLLRNTCLSPGILTAHAGDRSVCPFRLCP